MKIKFLFYFAFVTIGLIFSSVSCAVAQQPQTEKSWIEKNEIPKTENLSNAANISDSESFTLGRRKFNLIEKDGECVLSYEVNGKSTEITLKISPSCKVVRDNKENVRFFTYKDIKSDVFMIVGEVKDISGKLCGNQAQVVLLKKDSITPGKMKKGAVCTLLGMDEKDYWLLSH